MRRIVLALCLTIAMLCTACSELPGEERSFAVVLGLSESGGMWEACARIPSYQQQGGYLTLKAMGRSMTEAMALLNAGAPMQLHYGQLRMVVFSRELAESGSFGEALRALALRHDFRMQAYLCVTEDDLPDLLDALEPPTGSRLSKSLDVLIESRVDTGVAPSTTLANVLRSGDRVSPVLMRVAMEPEEFNTSPGVDAAAGDMASYGAGKVQFGGAYLTGANGSITGELNAMEHQLLALAQGRMKRGMLVMDQAALTLTDASSHVTLDGDTICLDVGIRMTGSAVRDESAAQKLTDALYNMIGKLSAAGCDALGIARHAILSCDTVQSWNLREWKQTYPRLTWQIRVRAENEAA